MPKLIEATLAEHRAHQRNALLDVALELLVEGGYPAMTFSALAARTGLARPSVYSYFQSRDDLAVAICERELPGWLECVQRAMDAVSDPADKVHAFVSSQFELATSGRHDLADLLGRAPLSSDARSRIRAIHERFDPKVTHALDALGVPDPARVAVLVQGVVNAGYQRVKAGEDLDAVVTETVAFILGGVDRLRAT